jgi:thiamine monophosphate synthase
MLDQFSWEHLNNTPLPAVNGIEAENIKTAESSGVWAIIIVLRISSGETQRIHAVEMFS